MTDKNNFRRKVGSISYIALAVFFIILSLSVLRVKLYGDPALSIAGNDTESYVDASKAPLFSAEILTGRRLLTTNLLYKVFEPRDGYEILVNGSIDTTRRALQPGFDRIVIFQLILSIIGWGALAWFFAENIRDPWLKLLGAILILAFAYTPQMADWDSILMSESLTFSLFALLLAFMIKIGALLQKDPNAKITGWTLAWGVTFFFWVFIKDTNLFTTLITIGMLMFLFRFPQYRKNKYLQSTVVFLALIFVLGFYTASISTRSLAQLKNLYKDDMLRSEYRTKILQGMGMPAVTQPSDVDTPEFEAWIMEEGSSTIGRFMFAHPGYPVTKLLKDFSPAFTEIKQTYFYARDLNPWREVLFEIGNALHPENTTPFLASAVLLMGILLFVYKNSEDGQFWAWLGVWLFLASILTFIPTILGDTWALNRHALYSTMILRLGMWIFPIILADLALNATSKNTNTS